MARSSVSWHARPVTRCPACARELSEDARFCPACGAANASAPLPPTRTAHQERGDAPARLPEIVSSRFLPGTLLARRYRIYGLLGVGGMGEVYRADDLKLGQAVALKFLPQHVERDPDALARFISEVRIARQISHPNVCRVHDVGEVDGHHFLSMEYVDGEDLASLLRRIGRLPPDKALQISRQLCAGLGAAHEQGVLHRDLKPANVMIDGRGRAKIADFGLAVLPEQDADAGPSPGTPAYMAPEQLAGEPATVASDVYALGLVLYELFTGKRAFPGGGSVEARRRRTESTPTSPSALVEGLDPAVERVILRCLASEPARRPAGVSHVAIALPGGDPLAAALAAGETPSPELVAEAGAAGGLRPGAAIACAMALALAVGLVVLLSARTQLSRVVPLPKSPEVLAERARDLIRTFGQTDLAKDSVYGFEYADGYLNHLVAKLQPAQTWNRLAEGRPSAMLFWFRQSPEPLLPYRPPHVDYEDPPRTVGGMAGVVLDPEGRLLRLDITPPESDDATGGGEPSWGALFDAAGLDAAAFAPVQPERTPMVYADTRAAWEGPCPGWPEVGMRVEAAGYHGRPIEFRLVTPWADATAASLGETTDSWVFLILRDTLIVAILIGGAWLARRNLRLGRGDRRGAATFALFMLAVLWLAWVLSAHHAAYRTELLWLFLPGLSSCVFFTCVAWVCYLAIEPYVRRTWPDVLVSWVRLLEGRFRDPLVGRDALLGVLAGSLLTLVVQASALASRWWGLPVPQFEQPPYWMQFQNLTRLRYAFANLLELSAACPFFTFAHVVSLLLVRAVVRKRWPTLVAYVVLWSALYALPTPHPYVHFLTASIGISLHLAVFLQLGLLASLLCFFTQAVLSLFPMTPDLSAWYAWNTILALLVLAALAAYGFRVALAGRPILPDTPDA